MWSTPGEVRRMGHAGHSTGGRRRCCFVVERCTFATSRRWLDPRVGLVGRRVGPSGASAAARIAPSFSRARARLRNCDRCSDAATVTTPATSRRCSRSRSIMRCASESTFDSTTSQNSSTRLSDVFTCWPPGPDDREKRHPSSDAGMVSAGETWRSMHLAWHGRERQTGQ